MVCGMCDRQLSDQGGLRPGLLLPPASCLGRMGHTSASVFLLTSFSLPYSPETSLLTVTIRCSTVFPTVPEPDFRWKVIGGWRWKSPKLSMGWQDNKMLVTGTSVSQ